MNRGCFLIEKDRALMELAMVLPTRPNEFAKIKSSRQREAKLELHPGCDRDQGEPDSDLAGWE